MLDLYCERQHSGLLAEPLNTLTNMAFVWAAVEAWNLASRKRNRTPGILFMCLLAGLVGIGSAIWHMYPTPWSSYLDLIPILLFQLSFLWLYLRKIATVNRITAITLLTTYVIVNVLTGQLPSWFNGSIMYLPTAITFALISLHYKFLKQKDGYELFVAGWLFLAAVLCRSIDLEVEHILPNGTHFLWHLLNGRVFFLIMKTVILNTRSRPD